MSSGIPESLCDKSVASTFETQKAQGLFFCLFFFVFFLTGEAAWLAASSAATSHPQSTLGEQIIESDTKVLVCTGALGLLMQQFQINLKCHELLKQPVCMFYLVTFTLFGQKLSIKC